MSLRTAFAIFASTLAAGAVCSGQTAPLHSSPGHDGRRIARADALSAATEVRLSSDVSLPQASRSGEVWLTISADVAEPSPAHITLRIPLASTGDVYGESRSCTLDPTGRPELTFTAGMDEANFIDFATSAASHRVDLLLNKYLCRALVAPFRCQGRDVSLSKDWSRWSLGRIVTLTLASDAPATLRASPVALVSGKAFDPATCQQIAPSNGLCCVARKTTEWHCGGTPVGSGWHQVSGECFHRETGASCTDKTVFPAIQP